MKKIMFVVLSALLFSAFIFMVKSEKESRTNIRIKGDSFIEGLRITHKNNGNPDWTLRARKADFQEQENLAYLDDVQIILEGKDMTIFADKGQFNMSNKNLSIEGNIIAKNNNYSIMTEYVAFDSEADTIKSDGNIRLKGKKLDLLGKGINIDNKEQKVRILKDVKATFYN
jgi:LPS export ABC transporter protein LptC